jgi:hypothetical protein
MAPRAARPVLNGHQQVPCPPVRAHGQTTQTWFFEEPVTSVNLTTNADIFLLVFASQVGLWSPRAHPDIRTIFRLPAAPRMRFNDTREDKSWRF